MYTCPNLYLKGSGFDTFVSDFSDKPKYGKFVEFKFFVYDGHCWANKMFLYSANNVIMNI